MLLLIAQTNLSEEHEHTNFSSLKIIYVKQERISYNFTHSKINLSEAREYFFKNTKPHRAQKDISEALEQFHSS